MTCLDADKNIFSFFIGAYARYVGAYSEFTKGPQEESWCSYHWFDYRNATNLQNSNSGIQEINTLRSNIRLHISVSIVLCVCFADIRVTITWCFSDRASWIDYILITNLMHWLLFIHKILISSTCFEPQVLIFRRIQLYTCSIWYCHSLWEFLVACRCVPTSHH